MMPMAFLATEVQIPGWGGASTWMGKYKYQDREVQVLGCVILLPKMQPEIPGASYGENEKMLKSSKPTLINKNLFFNFWTLPSRSDVLDISILSIFWTC